MSLNGEEVASTHDPPIKTDNPQPVRSSSRERTFTERGLEMHKQEAIKHKKEFMRAYGSWKEVAGKVRTALKSFRSQDELNKIREEIQSRHSVVSECYEPIQRNHNATPDIVPKMDACIALTAEISEIIERRLKIVDEVFNPELEKLRVRMALKRDEYGSIFGHTKTDTVLSLAENLIHSQGSSKHVDAGAELAAQQERVKAVYQIQAQEEVLSKLEEERQLVLKRLEEEKQVALKRIEANMHQEEKRLQQIQAESEVRIAEARVNAYESLEHDSRDWLKETDLTVKFSQLNPKANAYQPPQAHANALASPEKDGLTQALINSLSMNRLPAPEPPKFSGEALKYVDWKMSFMALIDHQPLPTHEKMFYLKNYLSGEARKAVEGFFYRNSEEAYQGALKVLEERYGNHFIVQKAFRDKLTKWPKVGTSDPSALREFADFLQGCVEAMPHVKGLAILDDCEENHKLLKKLPDWITRRWSRVVTERLDESGEYPSFSCFTRFIQKEARIACNPVASPLLIKATDDRQPKRTRALHTNTKRNNPTEKVEKVFSSKSKPPCPICKDEMHGVVKCPTFAAKSLEDKKAFIRENNLCYGCLRKGHNSKDCKMRHSCGICSRRHPTCLHEERENRSVEAKEKQSTSTDKGTSQDEIKVTSHAVSQRVFATSSIVPVFMPSVNEPQKEVITYALLDTQSDSTFVLEDLLEELNVETKPVQLKLSTMTAVDTPIASKGVYGLQVRGLQSEKQIQLHQAYTRGFIPVDKSYIPTSKTALLWPHLKHLANKLPLLKDCEVGLLIGSDCPLALAPQEVVTGGENDPFAQRTELGWSIVGSSNPHLDRQGNQRFVHRVTVKEIPTPSTTDVLKVLESDFNERKYADKDKYVSQDDVRFIQLLSGNITQRKDGHYEMPLPFKSTEPPLLPDNKKLATVRLHHLKKRLKNNERYKEQYKAYMKDMIKKGDAEPAPPATGQQTMWYIPHHGVFHPKKPEKLRVVFDCSAKFRGVSLNDTLLTGPDLINSLLGVLCCFRKEAVAIICDIEKMFHQFYVSPELRNYLRFLWWEDGDLEAEPQEYQMAVHLFGAASSPGCANFGLKYLARQHKEEYPSASAFVEKNFYVDDGLISVPSVEEAKELIAEARELCKRGGLRLHKFNSNERSVLDSVDSTERAVTSEPLNLDLNAAPAERALGIQWSLEHDTFSFNVNPQTKTSTRRGILSVIASLYDPVGFVAPFILTGKCILQELCRRGIGWDNPLPEDLSPRWERWKSDLQRLNEVSIPRCYQPQGFCKTVTRELHHFSDASNIGYGSCSYLRSKNEDGKVHCSLVMAKARVAPTKLTSIPRLELSAAVVAARSSVMLRNELEMPIHAEFFWTDSQVVLAYINNEARRFHVFVANRVQMIREHTSPSQWHYIDTKENPADHASRGLNVVDISSTNWLSGPKFLWEQEIHPESHLTPELLVGDPEVRSMQAFTTKVEPSKSDILTRLNRFSSWSKLLKVIARIKRLNSKQTHPAKPVSVEERERAAESVMRLAQEEAFSQEMKLIQKGKSLQNSNPLFRLDPILEGGALPVGGRLNQSSLSLEVKHPLILPKGGHITKLILTHCHERICHQGRNQTLTELRANGFWVIGGSKSVAKLIHRCVKCRRLRQPAEEQRMAELPKERVEVSAPFTYCGIDCFGPFITKKARKEQKRYGLIFTCLASRSVHIEMLEDLSTDAFINALRCFISLRGAVRQLHCDQGTNFVGAKNEFKEALKQCDTKTIESFLAERQCEFIFNAPSASHAGGVWERQIRTVRNVLNATLCQYSGRLDDSSLRTLFYEAMAIVNSRPLTVNEVNDPTSLEPLTPNHLILMKSKIALPPPGKFEKEDVYATKRWRRVQYLVEQFWSRWKREYLMNISTRQKWHTTRRNLKVDDLVIIKEDTPRNQWHLGRVVETKKESDGLVRRVKVLVGERTSVKQDRPTKPLIIERPIQKLVLLLESE